MSDKIIGTFRLDGIVQGKFGGSRSDEEKLRIWRQDALDAGLRFNLQVEGNSFNFLADNAPIQSARLDKPPQQAIEGLLDELYNLLEPQFRHELLSTVRSTEYQPGAEVQTLYIYGPDGKVQVRQRSVDAQTAPPVLPMTGRQKLQRIAVGLGVAIVLFLISSIFIDYKAMFADLLRQTIPFKAAAVKVETGSFSDYITVKDQRASSDGKSLVVTLQRTDRYPRDDRQWDLLLAQADGLLRQGDPPASQPATAAAETQSASQPASEAASAPASRPSVRAALRARQAIESLSAGYVRAECFDADGAFLGCTFCRLADLQTKDTVTMIIPLPAKATLARVALTN